MMISERAVGVGCLPEQKQHSNFVVVIIVTMT